MGKKMLLTIDGNHKKVKKPMVTVNGIHKKVKKAFLTVDGVHKLVYQSNLSLAELPVGSSVFMNMNGVSTEFLIVHQGLPDATIYDSSCDDTWLLMKNVCGNDYNDDIWFNDSHCDFQQSSIRAHLNDVVYFMFDSNVQHIIKQVKIPYQKGTGASGYPVTGSDGLPSKLFLLSGQEVGWTAQHGAFPNDGAVLDYFKNCTAIDTKRNAYFPDGTQANWWLRSNNTTYNQKAWTVWDGDSSSENVNTKASVRPALILSRNTPVDDKFNIIA